MIGQGRAPLFIACYHGRAAVVEFLLGRGSCSLQGVALTLLTLTRLKIRFGTSLDRENGSCGVFEEVGGLSDKGFLRNTCSPVPFVPLQISPKTFGNDWAASPSGAALNQAEDNGL